MGLIAAGVAAAGIAGSAIAGAVGAVEKSDAAGSAFDHAFAAAHAGNEAAKRAEKAALPSPQEIQALEGNLKSQEETIARERKLIEAVDPAIMEAGKQAYAMLQGQETAMLGPVKRQRERQKQQMQETLRRQLGPGFETSSAGIEAMSRFDSDTSDLMAQTQQNAVNNMLGIAQNASATSKQIEGAAQGRMNQTGQLFGAIQERQVGASKFAAQQFTEGGKLIGQAMGGVVDAAGGQAEAIGQGFGQVAKFGGYAASGGFDPKEAATAEKKSGNYGRGGYQDFNF